MLLRSQMEVAVRYQLRACAWLLVPFCAMLCFSQEKAQPENTGTRPIAGHDEAGRVVQPVTTNSVAPLPPTNPDQRRAFHENVKDVYFDFNRADLTADDQLTLQNSAEWLKSHPDVAFTIEGDADERGDIVYNVFLSDQRALETRRALVKLGVPENRILYSTGWGKLYPVCRESNESCWSQNRRSHLAPWPPEDLSKRAQTASIADFDFYELHTGSGD
jgi:outer membrane protein OmpA-like peptidoglycan-associated protein